MRFGSRIHPPVDSSPKTSCLEQATSSKPVYRADNKIMTEPVQVSYSCFWFQKEMLQLLIYVLPLPWNPFPRLIADISGLAILGHKIKALSACSHALYAGNPKFTCWWGWERPHLNPKELQPINRGNFQQGTSRAHQGTLISKLSGLESLRGICSQLLKIWSMFFSSFHRAGL